MTDATPLHRLRDNVVSAYMGNVQAVDRLLVCLLARGHVLIEDVPGVGKTVLANALARSIDCTFSRIQCTPDLLPSDITGVSIYHRDRDAFEFRNGPVFASVVLADEINRATPKTQSALLEAMQENSVSVAGQTLPLEQPFFVLATMNPLEMEGTYPLPEAQLDRFFFKLKLGFPSSDALHQIVDRTTSQSEPVVERIMSQGSILEMRETARSVPVARPVQDYAIRVTLGTHPEHGDAPDMTKRYVRFGSSPRGTQALILGAKVQALLAGRAHVSCDDIRAVALSALRHRILLNFEAEAERISSDTILENILDKTPLPKA